MAKRNAVVVTHTRLRQTGTVVAEAVSQLRVAGFEVTIIDNTEAPDFGVQPPCVSDDTEIVVVLGGDGTILRAAELVHCTQVPILGVNMGHVGFLAEFESFQIDEAIRRVSTHDYSFGADGVIVSTPTGSTAYAFSAGGPVMWPNVKALQLIPLAAHALFARPLIIGSGSTFTIDILDESMSEGWICCDGRRQRALPQGTRVMVRESRDTLRLARLSGVPFTNRLVSKFDLPVVGWREHARNEASSQSLHHGHTFPAAAYAAGVAVAGDAGVAGTEPDKPGERDGKAGS